MRRQITHSQMRSRMRRGIVLILSMIFIAVFSVLAVSMATISGNNLQISKNSYTANKALLAAESGLEVFRYWLDSLSVTTSLSVSQRLSAIAGDLQDRFDDAGVTNITAYVIDSEINTPTVSIGSESGQSFTAVLQQIDDDTLQLDVTGTSGQISRTIRTNFDFTTRADPIFGHSIATKGALHMSGSGELEMAVGASVYIDGEGAEDALVMEGNSDISGAINIHDPDATVSLSGDATIMGQSGQEAIDNHISTGVDDITFPAPDVSVFTPYIQSTFDVDTDTSVDLALDNVRIAAGTNPTFSGNVDLRGIIFIEQPNIVTFSGNATVTGIIVGDGDMLAPSDLNQLIFSGNVDTYSIAELPDEEKFMGLKDKTGAFLLAPGFDVSFSGNSHVADGTIAANGISFSGNAGGTINGTIMNYSDTPLSISGSSNLILNTPGTTNNPAGFTAVKTLEFVPNSYQEVY